MRHVSLALRNLLFSAGAILAPWWILSRTDPSPAPTAWAAIAPIVAGGILYVVCVWQFAVVGRGTPGPWDPPRRFVAVGPYRWVGNPIYIAALLVVFGEAWLFASLALFLYAGLMASLICPDGPSLGPAHPPSRVGRVGNRQHYRKGALHLLGGSSRALWTGR